MEFYIISSRETLDVFKKCKYFIHNLGMVSTVDKNGSVIAAEAGVKGTTNSHPCLLEPAKKTAFMHKWFSDSNAPSKQVGFVVVNFKLGE
mgnify:CR=1 FL=1